MTELTEAGQKAVAAGTRAADVVERQMLSALSAKEAKLLRDMLKRCAAALEDEPSCPSRKVYKLGIQALAAAKVSHLGLIAAARHGTPASIARARCIEKQ